MLSLGAYAFAEMSSMKICELPTSVTQIGNFAFRNDVALKAMNFNWDNLIFIGQYALSGCFSSDVNDKVIYLGGNIKYLDQRAISNIEHSPREFVIGDSNHPTQLLLGGEMPSLIMRFNDGVNPETVTFKVSANDYTALRTMVENGGYNGGKRIQVGSGSGASNVINIVYEQV